jgi:hypothetical protein
MSTQPELSGKKSTPAPPNKPGTAATSGFFQSAGIGCVFGVLIDKTQKWLDEWSASLIRAEKTAIESCGATVVEVDWRPGAVVPQGVSGLLINTNFWAPPSQSDDNFTRERIEIVHELSRTLPVVLVDGDLTGESSVQFDNVACMYEAAQHLTKLGHRQIAYIGHTKSTTQLERLAGLRKALAEVGVEHDDRLVLKLPPSPRRVFAGFPEFFATRRFTAVCCFDNYTAVGVVKAASRLNLEIPQDLSVVGAGLLPVRLFEHMKFSTIKIGPDDLANAAVRALVQRVGDPDSPALKMRVSGKLVDKELTLAVPRKGPPKFATTPKPAAIPPLRANTPVPVEKPVAMTKIVLSKAEGVEPAPTPAAPQPLMPRAPTAMLWRCAACREKLERDSVANGMADFQSGNLICKRCLRRAEKATQRAKQLRKSALIAAVVFASMALILPGHTLFIGTFAASATILWALLDSSQTSRSRIFLGGTAALAMAGCMIGVQYVQDRAEKSSALHALQLKVESVQSKISSGHLVSALHDFKELSDATKTDIPAGGNGQIEQLRNTLKDATAKKVVLTGNEAFEVAAELLVNFPDLLESDSRLQSVSTNPQDLTLAVKPQGPETPVKRDDSTSVMSGNVIDRNCEDARRILVFLMDRFPSVQTAGILMENDPDSPLKVTRNNLDALRSNRVPSEVLRQKPTQIETALP